MTEEQGKPEGVDPEHKTHARSNGLVSGRTRTVVLFLVAGVWVTNFAAGFFVESYQPDPQIHAVFMIVLGAIFASDFGSRIRGGGA